MNPLWTGSAPLPRLAVLLTLLAILSLTFLPWLGDTLFNTKGEPREALVAVSMIQSGNYVLPESYGADIPYKPPFLAWLIAGAAQITGGEVTETSSRLPSAIATIAMILAGFMFYSRRRADSVATAAMMALVTITSVEVYRAATACRVDMVLTACIVMSIYAMASLRERKGRATVSWSAIALMTMGVLTKGPIGAALPCLVMWVYSLMRGDHLWRATWTMAVSAASSLILPAMWYYAAWLDGGERFLRLAIEENFGRLTGTMSYDSHVNPWWYNLITLVAGMLPYTLLALFALASLRKHKPGPVRGMWARLRALDPDTLLAVVSVCVIFLFYCIPKSKRSVYLLPMYPFMAYLVTLLIIRLLRCGHTRIIRAYSVVIATVGLVAAWAVWGFHIVDASINIPGLKGTVLDLAAGLHNESFGIADWTLLIACILTCGATVCTKRRNAWTAWGAVASALTVYWVLGATVLPRTLNAKSDIVLAREIERMDTGLPVYSYNAVKMLRYYTAAFYLHDGIRLFAPEEGSSQTVASDRPISLPKEGLLIVNTLEMPQWQEKYGNGYVTDTLYTGTRRSSDCRAVPMIVRFSQKRRTALH